MFHTEVELPNGKWQRIGDAVDLPGAISVATLVKEAYPNWTVRITDPTGKEVFV